ncbi:sigma-70 family RNA polymerase sigma factor [Streptomyces fuscigenes]|nr:sigma-70 family RNA polymerase sigma factor [Streptomyces fuscigenes]MCF3960774.1 sigma-70 family RNA polymerase sigma factor [Streptomyces fuscigenes]
MEHDEGPFDTPAQAALAESFEGQRRRLTAVAFRILGSSAEAEDAVQEAWLRLARHGDEDIENLDAWLTTVVGRICLNMLRARANRREEPLDTGLEPGRAGGAPDTAGALAAGSRGGLGGGGSAAEQGPEEHALLIDSVGLALLVVLDTLGPAERLAFVLHDMFGVPFEDIAPVVERGLPATRQLASRARRRVRASSTLPETDITRQRPVVEAFLTAARDGDFEALLAVLAPDVVLRADATALRTGATSTRGAAAVATSFLGQARGAFPALLDGTIGLAWAPGGRPRAVIAFTVGLDGRVAGIDVLADPDRLEGLYVELRTELGR